MKRAIIIEVLLLFVLAALIALGIQQWQNVNRYLTANQYLYELLAAGEDVSYQLRFNNQMLRPYLFYGIFDLIAIVCDLIAIMLIALHNFPCFKGLAGKLAAHNQAQATAKGEKAEADKQARIEQLTAELEELKKDE